MKLRAIRLENVRRFVDPVEIEGIGNGLNVLSIPNERGKSTVFDALHAVFFKDRKSWDREIRSLAPYAGGDPSVVVEIELSDGRYRIEKRWNSRRVGNTQIIRSGRLIKQADDAEAWIAETLKSPKDGGPAGLLWVRQGSTSLDSGKAARLARRDLLTSVVGEVEAMTGGRRMDAARDRCRQELDRYLTGKGRPKSDSPLKHREDEVTALQAEHAELVAKSKRLRRELDQRRDLRLELAKLEDPEEEAKRKARLEEAKSSYSKASLHDEALEKATNVEHAKRAEAKHAEDRLKSLEKDLSESAKATEAYGTARRQEKEAMEQRHLADAEMSNAEKAHKEASDHVDSTEDILQRTLRAQVAAAAAMRRQELTDNLKRAEELRQQIEQATADAEIELSDQKLAKLEKLDENVRILRRTHDLEAVAVTMAYTSDHSDGVSLEGKPLRDGERTSIPDGAQLEVGDLGQLTIHPGRKADGETLAIAEAELAQALEAAGLGSIDDARASAQRRRDAEVRRRGSEAELLGIAPNGIEALRKQIAELPEQVDGDDDLPTTGEAQEAAEAAKRMLASARETYEAARAAHGYAETTAARASEAVESAKARVDRATATLSGIDDPETERANRREALSKLQAQLAEATRRREEIADVAPDLEVAKTALERAHSIVARAEEERQRIRLELGKLDTSIDIQAGEAVDEELADVEIRLKTAECRLNELRFEVDVLRKFDTTLKDAHESAKDRYVEPVRRELGPLLRLFWPESELRFDPETMLPTALVRAGTKEDFGILSGGTQEQIALLVRLAFARMLAKASAPAPVILDDAIVYTDDDRIERMFDALTRQAHDFQIIVFSCRQKAFRDLGGRGLKIALAGPAPPTNE